MFGVPPLKGLEFFLNGYPGLPPWANLGRPYGPCSIAEVFDPDFINLLP